MVPLSKKLLPIPMPMKMTLRNCTNEDQDIPERSNIVSNFDVMAVGDYQNDPDKFIDQIANANKDKNAKVAVNATALGGAKLYNFRPLAKTAVFNLFETCFSALMNTRGNLHRFVPCVMA